MKPIMSIQYLRGLAAVLVVIFHHANALHDHYAPGFPPFLVGAFGVDLFFVVSGFIMWMTTAGRNVAPGDFLRRRALRIVPLYWAFTLATAFVSTRDGLAVNLAVDYERLLRSLFFIPQWHADYVLVAPTMLVGWTLNLEMMFYLVFAGALALPQGYRAGAVAGLLALAAAARAVAPDPAHPALNLYTQSIVIEFGAGALLGALHTGRWSRHFAAPAAPFAGALFAAAGIGLLMLSPAEPDMRGLAWGAPALFICIAALCTEKLIALRPIGALKFIGDASYSIYLSHLMAMAVSVKLFGARLGPEAPLATLAGQTAFAVAAGCFVYQFVERPLTRLAQALAAPSGVIGIIDGLKRRFMRRRN